MREGQDLSQVTLRRTERLAGGAVEARRSRISPRRERLAREVEGRDHGRKKSLRERLRPVETETVPLVRRRPSSTSKRGASPVRWRRRSAWLKWLKPLTGAILIVGVPSALVVWLFTSPRFALQEMTVEIAGEDGVPRRVSAAWVRAELAPLQGENLLRLPLEATAERLEQHRWVRSVDLGKELPSRLQVRVIERREVALLRAGSDGLFYLDEEGHLIAPAEPAGSEIAGKTAAVLPRDTLVLIDGAGASEAAAALGLLRELAAVGPDWLEGLERIEVLREEDFKVHTTGLPFPLLLRAGAVEDSVRRMAEVRDQLEARYGREKTIDLRFDRRVIIEPSTDQPPGRGAREAAPGATAGGTTEKGER